VEWIALPLFTSHIHIHDLHGVVAKDIHDFDSNFSPPWNAWNGLFDPLFYRKGKAVQPGLILIPSNSRELKSGLYISSQIPRNSIVFLFLNHCSMSADPFSKFLIMSVRAHGNQFFQIKPEGVAH